MLRHTIYKIEDHIAKSSGEIKEIFSKLSKKVFEIDGNITPHPTKEYIGYAVNGKILAAIKFKRDYLIIELYRVQPEDLNDPKKMVEYIPFSFEYHNKHISRFEIKSDESINYALDLIRQVYGITFNKSN